MSAPKHVRIIGRDEEDNVMELCRKLHHENGMFTMDDDKVHTMLNRAFDKQGGILAGVGPKGKLEGLLYILLSQFWYSNDYHWEELFLYVDPEYRKSRNAVELLQFAKWCAEETDYPLFIGVLSNSSTERREKLYDRQLGGDSTAREELAFAKGALKTLNSLSDVELKDIKSVIGNQKKSAETKVDEAVHAIKQAVAQKGSLFLYHKKKSVA